MPRSYLFVPADRPDRYDKALAAGAGAVIVDLEDAVAPDAKAGARAALAGWLAQATTPCIVRVERAPDTAGSPTTSRCCAHGRSPASSCRRPSTRRRTLRVASARAGKRLYPLIESAAGFDAMRALAAEPGVERLVFGSIDFQVDVGIAGDDDGLLMVAVADRAGFPARRPAGPGRRRYDRDPRRRGARRRCRATRAGWDSARSSASIRARSRRSSGRSRRERRRTRLGATRARRGGEGARRRGRGGRTDGRQAGVAARSRDPRRRRRVVASAGSSTRRR